MERRVADVTSCSSPARAPARDAPVTDPSPGPLPRGRTTDWPRWFVPLFAIGIVACICPLVIAPVLPMCDVNGSAGVVGALAQRANPDSRVGEYFIFNIHITPNVFYWAVTWALSKVIPIRAASNLFVALFCVAGMPLGYLFALRTLGRHPALSFFALAAVFHRCVWYGFVDSAAAVGFLFFQIGFMNQAFTRRTWSWADVGLALTLLVLATTHAFLFLVGLGLWGLFSVLAWHQSSPVYRRVVVVIPALAYLWPWLASKFLHGEKGAGVTAIAAHLWAQRRPLGTYLTNAHEWFLNGYASSVDEVVVIIFVVGLLATLMVGLRSSVGGAAPNGRATSQRPDTLWRSRIAITAGLLASGYLLLPMSITQPFGWWAVNVRLLVPFVLVLGLLSPGRRRGLPAWTLLPVWGAATFYGLYIARDFHRWWMGVELRGFDDALQAIPVGQRVHAIYPAFDGERHYSHFPMAHIVDWYVVDRGGTATPWMTSHPKEVWVAQRPRPSGPWGMQDQFSWERFGSSWDYFLVKQPAPGNAGGYKPFRSAPEDAVRPIFSSGLWSVWKRMN